MFSDYVLICGNLFNEVVASGLWLAPGDSEEVASALSQALRNCIERSPLPPNYSKMMLILVISCHFILLNILLNLAERCLGLIT